MGLSPSFITKISYPYYKKKSYSCFSPFWCISLYSFLMWVFSLPLSQKYVLFASMPIDFNYSVIVCKLSVFFRSKPCKLTQVKALIEIYIYIYRIWFLIIEKKNTPMCFRKWVCFSGSIYMHLHGQWSATVVHSKPQNQSYTWLCVTNSFLN